MIALLAVSLSMLWCPEARAQMEPQVIETILPTADVVVASVVVQAPADGAADATEAIQSAIDEAAVAGGGVVFLPAGRYLLEGRLTLKEGVTLRGDWARPGEPEAAEGTVLMPVADPGLPDAPEAITLQRGSGVREVTVWYPRQDPASIVPYPWTFRTSRDVGGDNYTIHNVTLVNAYQAIRIGPEWNELHTVRNVYGTPLKTGIWVDTTTDIGRLIDVSFSPSFWAESQLPGAPITAGALEALREFIRREGVGLDMGRSDWEYIYGVQVDGYGIGFKFRQGQRGTTNAVMFGCKAIDCGTGLRVEHLNGIGLSATGCSFEAEQHAVHGLPSFGTIVQFNTCSFAASDGPCALLEGHGWLTFQNCSFDEWQMSAIDAPSGNVVALGCEFTTPGVQAILGPGVSHARLLGNRLEGGLRVNNNAARADVQIAQGGPRFERPDVSPHPAPPDPKPAGRGLFVVTDFGAGQELEDNTGAFAEALQAAADAGGGTVYIPAGNFRFAGHITVPSGVELRGIFDVPHHTISAGSVLMPTEGQGDPEGTPFIQLEPRSGLRGLTIWYPEQDVTQIKAYPWAIRGLGGGCWLVDVTCGNAYQGVDFWTNPSDGHLVRYLAGSYFRRGLFVSKCATDGWVEDTQFNPHYTARIPGKLPRPYEGQPWDPMIDYVWRNLEGIVFGRCAREHVKGTFLYAARDGLVFRDDGGGANARVIQHGTDAGGRGVILEAVGDKGVDFINAQIVHFGPTQEAALVTTPSFTGRTRLFNSQMWAGPVSGIIRGAGRLLIQQLNTLTGPFSLIEGESELQNVRFSRELSPHIQVGADVRRVSLISNMAGGELKVTNTAGERCSALGSSSSTPPPAGRARLVTGWEEGEPAAIEDTVATVGGGIKAVSGHQCGVTETGARSGDRCLRLSGNADDPDYSYVYFRILDGPLVIWPDTVLSYWIKPLTERGKSAFLDMLFDAGPPMRDAGATTVAGQSARSGAGQGEVGEWLQVQVPLGDRFAGRTITSIMFAYDSRSGGGPFEALLDDLSVTSQQSTQPWGATASPAGGRVKLGTKITLAAAGDAPIRYTLNGLLPDDESPVYQGPIELDRPGLREVRFALEGADGTVASVVSGALYEVMDEE